MSRRRTRMISFRVSEQEFELLKVRSETEGARNISEYARLALCRDRTSSNQVDAAVSQLSTEIQRLREQLLHMTDMIANSQGSAPPPPPYTHRTARDPETRPNSDARTLHLATRKTERV